MAICQTVAEMRQFFDFHDGGCTPPSIFKVRNYIRPCGKEGQCALSCQICGDRANRRWVMAIFDFQDGGRPPSWLLEVLNFNGPWSKESQTAFYSKFDGDRASRRRVKVIYRFHKMAAVHHLGFLKIQITKRPRVKMANFRHDAKCGGDRSNHRWDMAILIFSRWRHFWFFKVRDFNSRYGAEDQYASQCQISCRSYNLLSRYGDFRFF